MTTHFLVSSKTQFLHTFYFMLFCSLSGLSSQFHLFCSHFSFQQSTVRVLVYLQPTHQSDVPQKTGLTSSGGHPS